MDLRRPIMRSFSASFALLFLLACLGSSTSNDTGSTGSGDSGADGSTGTAGESGGEGGEGGEGSGGSGGGTGDPPAFEPIQGEWNFVDGSIISDSCDYDYDSLPSGGDGFSLSLSGNQDFAEILLDGTTDGFQCAWDAGKAFQCSPVDGSEDLDDLDTVIVESNVVEWSVRRGGCREQHLQYFARLFGR